MTDGLILLPGRGQGMRDAGMTLKAGAAQSAAWSVTASGWGRWESRDGTKVARGGPGSFMFVPAECPHAFANPGPGPARMLFVVTPAGHERYLTELASLLASPGPPDQAAISELRARHDIEQLTPLNPGRAS